MNKHIALLPWDGIGPEIMSVTTTILDEIATKYDHKFTYTEALVWWAAYEKFEQHLPEGTVQMCKDADAILLWAIWWPVDQQHLPKWKNAEKNALLGLRKELWLAINVRPVQLHGFLSDLCPLKPSIIWEGIDFVVIRELIWGIYFGKHETFDDYAIDEMKYTREQIETPVRYAAQVAMGRDKKVIVVDKANVLDCSRLWREVVENIKGDYPEIEREYMYVDNAAMQLIRNPGQFDVVVTGNMFGDILTDAASVLPGSLGLMPSSSVGKEYSLYEPIHGSAPDIAGKWIANPIAMLLSAEMMLRHSFWLTQEADDLQSAILETLRAWYRTGDIKTWTEGETSVWSEDMMNQIISRI